MNDTVPPSPVPARRNFLGDPSITAPIIAALAIGLAIGLWLWARPQSEFSPKRYETARDILTLFDLQLSYKNAKGVYANDLDSLLAISPQGAAIKARLAQHLDMGTLVVGGGADKFRLEANALDAQRTLVKISGPVPKRAHSSRTLAEASSSAGSDAGAPVAPPPAR